MTIINGDSRVITKLESSLTDDARVIIYNCHMFIVQATDLIFSGKATLLTPWRVTHPTSTKNIRLG